MAQSVVNEIQLIGEHLFDHTPVVRNEINKFIDHFEKNERHKEFDGILRASHALVEAAETGCESMFDDGRMVRTTEAINHLTDRINKLVTPTYKEEHDEYLSAISSSQLEYLELCKKEAHRKMRSAAGLTNESA